MDFGLSLFQSSAITKKAVQDILRENDVSRHYGLELSEKQAAALVETRNKALRDTGRVEIGGGVIDKMIYAFCDSPYVSQSNYEETLHELLALFYSFKNETDDKISDDDLISFMKEAFDVNCFGSLELLAGRELYALAQQLKGQKEPESTEEREEGDAWEQTE